MQLLRYTAGACRVQHIAQALPTETISSGVLMPTQASLKAALEEVIGAPLNEQQWVQASLPVRKGGLGLADPTVAAHAARFAMLVNAAAALAQLGVPQTAICEATLGAASAYWTQWGLHGEVPMSSKTLQKELTDVVHDLRRARLVANACPTELERLVSVATPHALDWAQGSSPWFSLTPAEVRQATRWVLGVPLRTGPYQCPFCGIVADAQGLHAVACSMTGPTAVGHSVVKRVLGTVYREAGATVDFEQPRQRNGLHPADLLVSGLTVKTTAIDLIIWSYHHDGPDPLDAVVERKLKKNKPLCVAKGWQCKPWAADVYGGLHPAARQMLARGAREVAKRNADSPPAFASSRQMVWRAVSTAVLSRAAVHLVRHQYAGIGEETAAEGEEWVAEDQADLLQEELVERGEQASAANGAIGILGISRGGPAHQPDAADPEQPSEVIPDGVDQVMAGEAGEPGSGGTASGAGQRFWSTTPNSTLGLAPWPQEVLLAQVLAPVVPLCLHSAGRARLNTHAALSMLIAEVHLQAAAAWGVAAGKFQLTFRGVLLDPTAPLFHYTNEGAVLEAVALGPR
jgi:hypothetical protein